MTIDQGLFDIQRRCRRRTRTVKAWFTPGPPAGQRARAAADRHRIYMVAVPKNDALTMLLGGNIGFATSASVVNGTVVLSAGFDIGNGNIRS